MKLNSGAVHSQTVHQPLQVPESFCSSTGGQEAVLPDLDAIIGKFNEISQTFTIRNFLKFSVTKNTSFTFPKASYTSC